MIDNDLFIKIFNTNYLNINNILTNKKISSFLEPNNNSYLSKLCLLYPNEDINKLKAYSLSMLCILIIYINEM